MFKSLNPWPCARNGCVMIIVLKYLAQLINIFSDSPKSFPQFQILSAFEICLVFSNFSAQNFVDKRGFDFRIKAKISTKFGQNYQLNQELRPEFLLRRSILTLEYKG